MSALPTYRIERLIEVMQEIQRDCEADAHRTEGLPMTGRNMGELWGGTFAMISSVAHAVELLASSLADGQPVEAHSVKA